MNATPSTRNESRMEPPITFFTPIILGSSKSGRSVRSDVGVAFKGVRSGVERRRGVSGLKARDLGGEKRREKSLRIDVHHANAVVWGPVYEMNAPWSRVFTASTHILREELLLAAHELRGQRRHRALLEAARPSPPATAPSMETAERLAPCRRRCRAAARKDLMMFWGCTPSSTKGFALAEELAGEDDDRGRAVAHLRSRGERA